MQRVIRTGTVKWFNDQKGYGFIADDTGKDVFVHHTQIKMKGHRSLQDGCRVTFRVEQSERNGRDQAVEVTVIEAAAARYA